MVDFDPVLEPCLNLPPCLPFILPVVLTFLWLIFWVGSHSHTVAIRLHLKIVLKWGDFHPRNQSSISTDSGGDNEIQVKIIRCDNAGENTVLETESDKNDLGIFLEYTAQGTLQQNGVVESICNSHGTTQSNDQSCRIRNG